MPILALIWVVAMGDVVRVERDGVVIDKSCRVEVVERSITDPNSNGVISIVGDGITVDFGGATLRGNPDASAADRFTGIGIHVTGKNVTLRGAKVHGYKIGIHATVADGLVLEDCDVSGNRRQRLLSTPAAENSVDWIWPHENDAGQWRQNYGAGICIERSRDVTVRRCRARDGQNGLILDRATDSRIYDNDFSFLSGWGIALWRSERNIISRNALDFCVRGYSHGVYNRGQDSAGILMFEQCSENAFIENSATHGGDGFFAFGGKEALGEVGEPREQDWYRDRGNRGNVIAGNDFSYAAAHGLELTFSFDNVIRENRFVGNAICGIWGGYSQRTMITGNLFERNGDAGYGNERGGVNIEHGRLNVIEQNEFRDNAVGVHLWWDDDKKLLGSVWAKANHPDCADETVVGNTFERDALAIRLRRAKSACIDANRCVDVKTESELDEFSTLSDSPAVAMQASQRTIPQPLGESRPVGARKHLAGREKIIITHWGPYDWASALLLPRDTSGRRHTLQFLSPREADEIRVEGSVSIASTGDASTRRFTIAANKPGGVEPYKLRVRSGEQWFESSGRIIDAKWSATAFAWSSDPREHLDSWRLQGKAGAAAALDHLHLLFGNGGPSRLKDAPRAWTDAQIGSDRFGIIATTSLHMPAGEWKLTITSDDGVRVLANERVVFEDWTWHGPKTESATLKLDEPTDVVWCVEYFELDGYAMLDVKIE